MYRVGLQLDEIHELYEKLLWDAEQQLLKGKEDIWEMSHALEEAIRYLILPYSPFSLLPISTSPVSCRLSNPEDAPAPNADSSCVINVAISSNLFRSSMLIDDRFWIWSKGDEGHLGLGHENSVFVPTKNHNIDSLRSIELGGIHLAARTTRDDVFT
ncbi:hypothetical protein ACLOJK_035555 [Asimina triloba]